MRASWRGFISIGRIGIPIRLYNATRSDRPDFIQLHEADGSPVERVLKCLAEDHEVPYAEIVRAVEYEPGKYITLTPRELATYTFEEPKVIDIKQFCGYEEIPSLHFDKPYYIVPSKGGEKAYGLLREALFRSGKTAVASY